MKKIDINDFNKENTVVYIIDMNNGFAKRGNLYSPNVKKLIPSMVSFLTEIRQKEITVVTINDKHNANAREFKVYPPHCVKETDEWQTVAELKNFVNSEYYKNSTNAILAIDYQNLFKDKQNVIVIGCVTDICIKHFAITLNKYFDQFNLNKKVIVIEDLVTTFDMLNHDAAIFHQQAITEMVNDGVEVVNYKEPQQFNKTYIKT